MKSYRHTHNKEMGTKAVAQMTATMLYHKRFFPYYVSNILAGLDEDVSNCFSLEKTQRFLKETKPTETLLSKSQKIQNLPPIPGILTPLTIRNDCLIKFYFAKP